MPGIEKLQSGKINAFIMSYFFVILPESIISTKMKSKKMNKWEVTEKLNEQMCGYGLGIIT